MKIKPLIFTLSSIISLCILNSCNDDLREVGSSIRPGGDGITVTFDTAYFKAKTVKMDSIYARTTYGLLGKYEDDVFGTIKADYLCEFYCPEKMAFQEEFLGFDSIQLAITFMNFTGDTLAPMGLSTYRVTNPLQKDFYSNMDPTQYCNMQEPLGSNTYTIAGLPKGNTGSVTYRIINLNLDEQLGIDFYNESKRENNAFQNSETLKKFFPGMYVTTTFGTGNVVYVEGTSLNMYYRYSGTVNDTVNGVLTPRDTIYNAIFSLGVTPEVIQLNHIENDIPNNLLTQEDVVYIKTPAGLYANFEFPLFEIMSKSEENVINSAKFELLGNSEKESLLGNIHRPPTLLLIHRDSISSFFENKKNIDSQTTFAASWSSTNKYTFTNIARLLSFYVDKYNTGELTENPVFALVPIEIATNTNNATTGIYNYMKPSTSIIRNTEEDMKINLIFSKY